MRNTNKKGFTIVELVIVVAVIAILAAVLIPTFAGIIHNANKSTDTTLVKNLNTALAAYVNEALDGDEATIDEALAAAAEFGYDVGKINAKAEGNEILWDSVANVFCYLNDGDIEYIPESVSGKTGTDAELWIIDNAVNPTYSTYLHGFTATEVEAIHSLHVGNCGIAKVTYKAAGSVSITTNGGELVVSNPDAEVKHYGAATKVTVKEAAPSSYYEFGEVQSISIEKGNLVIKENATVGSLEVKGNDNSVTVTVTPKSVVKTLVVDNTAATVKIEDNAKVNAIVAENANNITIPESVEVAPVTKTSVANEEELTAALTSGAKFIVISEDITVTANGLEINNNVTIDGSNNTITFKTNRGFKVAKSDLDVSVKNLALVGGGTSDSRAFQVNSAAKNANVTLDNVDMSGGDYTLNIVASCSGVTINAIDCEISGWAAVNVWGTGHKLTFVNCDLTGTNDVGEDESNSFGVIVIEADTTEQTNNSASNIAVNVIGGSVTAIETNRNSQFVVTFNGGVPGAYGSTATFSNVKIVEAKNGGLYSGKGNSNSLIIDGEVVWSN